MEIANSKKCNREISDRVKFIKGLKSELERSILCFMSWSTLQVAFMLRDDSVIDYQAMLSLPPCNITRKLLAGDEPVQLIR